MFARERSCPSWRLPENPTILDDVQRNGSTLDTRFRCVILKGLASLLWLRRFLQKWNYKGVCACAVSPAPLAQQSQRGQDLEGRWVHLLIVWKFAGHHRQRDWTRWGKSNPQSPVQSQISFANIINHQQCVCVCVIHVVSAAFITMLLQGSAVGVWISLKWTGYRNWSPVEGDLTVSSSELKNRNSTRWPYFRLHNFFQRLSAESNWQFWWAEIRAGSLNYFIRWCFFWSGLW